MTSAKEELELLKTCANCQYFKRGKWHRAIDPTESEQYGGDCKMLPKWLSRDNSNMLFILQLYVYENFTCGLFVLRKQIKLKHRIRGDS